MSIHKIAAGPWGCSDLDVLALFLGAGTNTNIGGRNRYPCTYLIYTDGTYFYAENGTTGQLVYGGPSGEGGAAGGDADAVIQAAVTAGAAGGIFVIKDGVYPLSAAIQYQAGQKFFGMGIDRTIFTVATDISVFEPPDYVSNRSYVGFFDFSMRVDDTSTTGPALDLSRMNYTTVKRVAAWSNGAANLWHTGILIDTVGAGGQAYYNLLEQCNIGRFGTYGIRFDGIAGARANVNHLLLNRIGAGAGATATSVSLDFADYIHVEHCNLGGAQTGITCDNAAMIEIDQNFFEGVTGTCINLTANASETMLRRNYLSLVGPTLVTDLGTDTRYDNNNGYVTYNTGTATILNGTAAIVVAHGLDVTPSSIRLTGAENHNEAHQVVHHTVGAANFTIQFTGGGNVTADRDVDWVAEYQT